MTNHFKKKKKIKVAAGHDYIPEDAPTSDRSHWNIFDIPIKLVQVQRAQNTYHTLGRQLVVVEEPAQRWRSVDECCNIKAHASLCWVPAGSPSRGGDVAVYVWHKPTELSHSFLFCSCVCFCLYGPFNCIHSISSPDNSPLSHSVLPVLFLHYWSFELYISLRKSPSAPI